MTECKLCGSYVIEIAQHVAQLHHKTMQEYKIETNNITENKLSIRRKNLWD